MFWEIYLTLYENIGGGNFEQILVERANFGEYLVIHNMAIDGEGG